MVSPVLIILALAMLAGVAYMALSRKSSFKLRVAALGALGVMVVTAIICSLVIFKTNKVVTVIDPEHVYLDIPPPVKENNNVASLVMFILFLVAVFVLVLVFSLREQKRTVFEETEKEDKSFGSSW